MKQLISELVQTVGFLTAVCGIICCMCETEYQLHTMFLGIMLLLTGVLICHTGKEMEYGTN